MAKSKAYDQWDENDIFNAWVVALKSGLKPGQRLPKGFADDAYFLAMKAKLAGVLKTNKKFSAAAARDSGAVAKHLGRILAIITPAGKAVELGALKTTCDLRQYDKACRGWRGVGGWC